MFVDSKSESSESSETLNAEIVFFPKDDNFGVLMSTVCSVYVGGWVGVSACPAEGRRPGRIRRRAAGRPRLEVLFAQVRYAPSPDFIYTTFSGDRGLDFIYTNFRGFVRTLEFMILKQN